MSRIIIKARDIKIETDDLETLPDALRSILETIVPVETEPEWEEVWEESNHEVHQGHYLHMYVNYCEDQGIGFIKIFVGQKEDAVDWPNLREEAVFGTNHDVIRQAIKLWDKYNTEQYVADFVAKQAEETKTVE